MVGQPRSKDASTRTHLDAFEEGLLQRYAPPQNLEDAEWRVNTRMMIAGESYADYAAGLREAADRNPVEERVFLAQFYRNLDRTTRQLVKQPPVPRTLEKAVKKATQLSDPLENVTRGMHNIGQTFPAAHATHLVQVNGPSGSTVMIPGGGGVSVPGEVAGATTETGGRAATETTEQLALFTNPQGVYNRLTGMIKKIPGRRWTDDSGNRSRRVSRARKSGISETKPPAKKAKTQATEPSGGESDTPPKTAKTKAAVKPAGTSDSRQGEMRRENGETSGSRECRRCGGKGHWSMQCPNEPRCFACNRVGHFARMCTDSEAKARNDEYMRTRGAKPLAKSENEQRTT